MHHKQKESQSHPPVLLIATAALDNMLKSIGKDGAFCELSCEHGTCNSAGFLIVVSNHIIVPRSRMFGRTLTKFLFWIVQWLQQWTSDIV